MQKYDVPDKSQYLVSTAGQLGIAAAFGVGINSQIAIFKSSKNEENFEVPNGLSTQNYNPDAPKDSSGNYMRTAQWDGYMSSSLNGMPVLTYLKFVGGNYIDLQGNQVIIPDVTFETVLINVTQGKNVSQSSITGRNTGTIKEQIGMLDWKIDINAVITADAPVNKNVRKKSQDGTYPYDNISEILKILNAPISLEINCRHLNQLGIKYVVIMDGATINQTEGEYSMQRIFIPAVSDFPLILKFAK